MIPLTWLVITLVYTGVTVPIAVRYTPMSPCFAVAVLIVTGPPESLFPALRRGGLRLVVVVAECEVEHQHQHHAHDDPHPRAPLRFLWRRQVGRHRVLIRPGSTRVSLRIGRI